MRQWPLGLAFTLSLFVCVLTQPANGQKAQLRKEMGLQCHAVAAGLAKLVRFPATTQSGQQVNVEGILRKPDGPGPFAAVIIMHGGPGIFPPRCYGGAQQLFHGLGYMSLVVDSYSAGDLDKGRRHAATILDRTEDAWAAASYLASRADVAKGGIGIWGVSTGGLSTLLAVSPSGQPDRGRSKLLAAAVAVAPECPHELEAVVVPLLVLHGEDDRTNPVEDCRQMRVSGDKATDYQFVTYPDAGHTFDFPGSSDYNAHAAQDSGRRTKEFYKKYLNGG